MAGSMEGGESTKMLPSLGWESLGPDSQEDVLKSSKEAPTNLAAS